MKVKAFAKHILGIQYNDEKYDSARRCYRKVRDRQRLHNGVFPSSFILETCTYCNALCDYCRRTKMIADGRFKPSIMPMELYEVVIDELAKLDKPRTLSFVGLGDWLLDPYIHERFEMAHQRLGGWTFSTITNGIALTSNIQKELVGSLDSIVISLNIFDRELYSKYNGVDKFDLVVEQTKAFLALKGDSKPSVKVQLLLTDKMRHCQVSERNRVLSKTEIYTLSGHFFSFFARGFDTVNVEFADFTGTVFHFSLFLTEFLALKRGDFS